MCPSVPHAYYGVSQLLLQSSKAEILHLWDAGRLKLLSLMYLSPVATNLEMGQMRTWAANDVVCGERLVWEIGVWNLILILSAARV